MTADTDIFELVDRALCTPAGFLTLRQTADELGVSTDDVYAMVRRRDLDAVCTPRTGFLVARTDVEGLRR